MQRGSGASASVVVRRRGGGQRTQHSKGRRGVVAARAEAVRVDTSSFHGSGGFSGEIPAGGGVIEESKCTRAISEDRGASWCAEIERRGPPFIGGVRSGEGHGGRRWSWLSGLRRGKARTGGCSAHDGESLGGDGTGRGGLYRCGARSRPADRGGCRRQARRLGCGGDGIGLSRR